MSDVKSPSESADHSCHDCGALLSPPANIHASRRCGQCHRDTFVASTQDGLRVEQGDQVHIPAGAIRISLDPNQSTGRLVEAGIPWFIGILLGAGLISQDHDIWSALNEIETQVDRVQRTAPELAGLDIDNPEDTDQIIEIIQRDQTGALAWATRTAFLAQMARGQLHSGENSAAAKSSFSAGVAWAIYQAVSQLSPLVWRGYDLGGADAIKSLVTEWTNHLQEPTEEYWQKLFEKFPLVLNRMLPFPMVLVNGKAYVGGKSVSSLGGGVVDLLAANPLSGNCALVEIKTPATPLLRSSQYRSGVWAPSAELAGAIIQVLTYRATLAAEASNLLAKDKSAFAPTCVLVVGSLDALDTEEQRRSFELLRGSVGVTIITFDELLRRLEDLLEVLRLGS